jgi:salicylate hydroxylase
MMAAMAAKSHVLIAGAGIGGLCAALALLRRGFPVSVFERVPELKEIGAGFHCSPNGTKVLLELGLKEAIDRVAVRMADRDVRLWNTGQAWTFPGHGAQSEARYGAPYLLFHRGDLHAILVDAVRNLQPDALHVNARCVGFAARDASVVLELEGGRRVEGDVLIGADGIHSAIRHGLFGPDRPRFIGQIAWRGLVPAGKVPDHLRASVSSNWVGPNGSVTAYPVRRGELLNFVGYVERDDWRVESWTQEGTIEECEKDFVGWHPDVHRLIHAIQTPFKWALFLREPLERWSKGRVSLLGDACHATIPSLGQGANMAIEDAMVLARCLGEDARPEQALARYEAARRPRTTRVFHDSTAHSKRLHNPSLAEPESALRHMETHWAPEKIRGLYDWIFEYDALHAAI